MIDENARLKGELDDALSELTDLKEALRKVQSENESISSPKSRSNEKLLNENNDLSAKLSEALSDIKALKNDLLCWEYDLIYLLFVIKRPHSLT